MLADRAGLLRQATDRPDRAVERDRASHGDVPPAGQVAFGQLVDESERERQAGGRAPDPAGVDIDLERQGDDSGVERTESDDRAGGIVRGRRELDGHVEDAHVGAANLEVDRVARQLGVEHGGEVLDRVQLLALGFENRVGRVDGQARREELGAQAVVTDLAAEDFLYDDFAEADLGLVASGGEGDELGLLGCRPHLLQRCFAPLRRRPDTELVLGGEESRSQGHPGRQTTRAATVRGR